MPKRLYCLVGHEHLGGMTMNKKRIEQKKKRVLLDGFGTIEVVIIIAVLITIALLFRENIIAFARSLIDKVFKPSIISEL